MKKSIKDRKTKTFVYHGLGIPIKLINVPMRKIVGEWCIDINMNKLMLVVLQEIIHKPTALTGDELRYIRSHLEMTTTEFGKTFGVSHVAVLKWEGEKNNISPALELCIRLYVLNFLRAKDREFRALYNDINLQQLSKGQKGKIHPIAVDATTEELKIAL
jgi:DNA-binding transcriptional regulator YiaG